MGPLYALTAIVTAASPTMYIEGCGTVRGISKAPPDPQLATVEVFSGLPYAKPPVGDLRFAPPVDYTSEFPGGTLDATTPGNICPQPSATGAGFTGNEDCLTLNVFRERGVGPGDGNDGNRTIMVWVHGGAFVIGAGSLGFYDGTALAAEQHVIVVSINYRLGALGWLALPKADDTAAANTNFGFQDQTSALRWVQRHANDLGGDPNKVLIVGESAGGMSVQMHAVSPPSSGLFQRVMSESGFPTALPTQFSLDYSLDFAMAHLGCNSSEAHMLECLRALPADNVIAAQVRAQSATSDPFTQVGWSPTVDGAGGCLPDDPRKLFTQGKLNAGIDAFGAGTNNNEGTMFVLPYFPDGMNASLFSTFVYAALDSHGATLNGTELAEVMDMYPCTDAVGDCLQTAADLIADQSFVCGSRWALRGAEAPLNGAVYMYHYDYRAAGDHGLPPMYPDSWGIYHTIEIPFLFHNPLLPLYDFTAAEHAFSTKLGGMWAGFASEGVLPDAWPRYTIAKDQNIVFSNHSVNEPSRRPQFDIETGRRASQCDMWDRIAAAHPSFRGVSPNH